MRSKKKNPKAVIISVESSKYNNNKSICTLETMGVAQFNVTIAVQHKLCIVYIFICMYICVYGIEYIMGLVILFFFILFHS